MSKQYKALVISMISNLFISLLKLLGGIFGKSQSLIADGLHTMSDFVTDIVAMIGSKISGKKANKHHPYGYGMFEYITSVLIGIVILGLGLFLSINSFTKESKTPDTFVIVIISIAIILKGLVCLYLKKTGKKINSNILISSANESFTDVYSSIGVLVIVILSQFSKYISILKYSDQVGSLIIGILIIMMGFNILKDNLILLIGEQEDNKDIRNNIEKIIEQIKDVETEKITLIKYGSYYSATITIKTNPYINLIEQRALDKKIKDKLKKAKFGIKYSTIEMLPNMEVNDARKTRSNNSK